MAISKMLSKDLETLEKRYESKVSNVEKFLNTNPNDSSMRIYENCYRALEQLRRLRAVFERTFR